MISSDVNVVICSYQGDDLELTLRTLAVAVAQAGPGRVILVDMSPDERVVAPAREIDGARVYHLPESEGLGPSRQYGLEQAEARHVAFLDSDAVPREGWLEALRRGVDPADVAVAGGPVLPVWPEARVPRLFRTQPAGDFLSMLDLGPEPKETPRVLPGNMIVDRELTGESVFPSAFGRRPDDLFSAEEIAMMKDVVRRELRIVYVPGAKVDHRTTPDRMSWRWMWRRVEAAGREAASHRRRLEPLPRKFTPSDRAFLAAVAIPFFAGRLRAPREGSAAQPSRVPGVS